MKKIILIGYLLLIAGFVFGQKNLIDSNTFGKWPEIQRGSQLSADGNYAMYLEDRPAKDSNVLHIVSIGIRIDMEKTGIKDNAYSFSNDGKKAVFLTKGDSLNILTLKTHVFSVIGEVQDFKIAQSGNWIAFRSIGSPANLTILNMVSGRRLSLSSTISYQFNTQGDALVVYGSSLIWLDLKTGKSTKLWENKISPTGSFDNSGSQFAFYAQASDAFRRVTNVLCLYKKGWEKAKIVAGEQTNGLKGYALTDEQLLFSTNGDKLLISIDKINASTKAAAVYPNVRILNTNDPYIDDDKRTDEIKYKAVVSLTNDEAWCVNPNGAEAQLIYANHSFENYLLLNPNPDAEKKWWLLKDHMFDLINLKSKQLTRIHIAASPSSVIQLIEFTPDEHYLVWFNPDSMSYYSYAIATGALQNISRYIPYSMGPYLERYGKVRIPWGTAGYDPKGGDIYLYDQYDIWKVTLSDLEKSINVTNGYGRKNGITFGKISYSRTIVPGQSLWLSAYNSVTKQNGFFKLNAFGHDPEKVCLEDCSYWIDRTGTIDANTDVATGVLPVKAKNANVYLVRRQTASEYPNLYVSRDLKSYQPVSNIHPEKQYNWMTAELLNWKDKYGELNQGILYKPENFDSNKRYPVIFNYYIRESDMLHAYLEPDWTIANINIPYFVSNGYLVFVPDMHYYLHKEDGELESIVSSAKYLSKLAYVDSARMGINGHSLGGTETNYIVTHTRNLFAAACSADGMTDLFSADFNFSRSGSEIGSSPSALNGPAWANSELYIKESAILGVAQTTTPILLVQGVHDPVIPYEQAMEFYHALRRANKKCWFLTYPNSGHWPEGEDGKDFNNRIKQFFDYYLKGALPPLWMTSTSIDGRTPISTSLELDSSGKQP